MKRNPFFLAMLATACLLTIVAVGMGPLGRHQEPHHDHIDAHPEPYTAEKLSQLEELPCPVNHPEAYVRAEPYTQKELALLAEAHEYMDAVNSRYGLSIYIPDPAIAEADDIERFKMAIDLFTQELLESQEETERAE